MKKIKKVLSLLTVLSLFICFSLPVSADPANTIYGDHFWVSAGASEFSDYTSTTTAFRYTCYMRLTWFHIQYYPYNNMPTGYHIYSRLYSGSQKATNSASFTYQKTTASSDDNYYYWDDYGASGTSYRLKTNSDISPNTYEAYFDWSANPYF